MEHLILYAASFVAGLVDSIVGGGGLILVPTMFAVFPNAAPPALLGTNKSASVWGTSIAALQYSRRVDMPWRVLGPAMLAALISSFFGAWVVTIIDPYFMRVLLPLILLLVFIYTLYNKHLGKHHSPRYDGRLEVAIACAIALVIGFYDGFLGPGTGSFFIFLFVRLLGYDFLNASASAKVLNVATNIAAITLFALKGQVWWQVGLAMGMANVLGSLCGSRLALKHGAGFVRYVFIVVVGALILKTTWDALAF